MLQCRHVNERKVTPEILDELPPDDPEAIRSRRDLRLVNALMDNYRWIARQMADFGDGVEPWFELGAGDGELARHLQKPPVTGIDLAPRPTGWPEDWAWEQGDLFETFPALAGGTDSCGVVANLFLHHFENPGLARLGELFSESARVLIVSEPARFWLHRIQGYATTPFVNRVTHHDLHVSIEAGFRAGELPEIMGLGGNFDIVEESRTFFGSYRLVAVRK
ncbi:MAG: class I SAM-dependent methyltransferase [Verrucomicrobiales bacterium]|nr:class I SAM-dependent methyltransferase [Verrucomicrobiales bacterium]